MWPFKKKQKVDNVVAPKVAPAPKKEAPAPKPVAPVKEAPKAPAPKVAVPVKEAPKAPAPKAEAPVKKAAPQAKKETKAPDYSAMTVVQLRALAKKRKLEGYSSLKKADLIKLLK